MKKKKLADETWRAYISVDDDGNPMHISWYKENLQDNVRRMMVRIVPAHIWRRILKEVKRGKDDTRKS